uniref:Uncharacterized protein n=1 Tax=viral metagenome TaxID=1070528 RepID=A0A6C0D278_9ZZZZ
MEKFWRTIHARLFAETQLVKPLGRWCFCGDKLDTNDHKTMNVYKNNNNNTNRDALQWKERQKQKRLEIMENKQDPFEIYKKKCSKNDTLKEKQREEYMIPFVFDL